MALNQLLALVAVLAVIGAAAGAPDLFLDPEDVDVDADYEDTQQPREGSTPLLVSALKQAAETANLPVNDMATQWADFKVAHGKSYDSHDEEAARIGVFADNLQYINEHNARYENGETTFYMGVNQLADLTSDEIAAFYLGQLPELPSDMPTMDESELANVTARRQVDWRRRGVVTPVKDQRQCRSCWAFAATGALEGANARKTRRLRSFSEQQLVDCARGDQYWSKGCNGGFTYKAIEYVRDHGIASEQAYPYAARDGHCHYRPRMRAGGATGFRKISSGAVARAVARFGPLAVSLDAGQRSFGFYRGGLYYDHNCSMQHHNHAVLLVGYNRDYWLLKNSWAETWGERGYMRMARRRGNDCGVTANAVLVTV